MVISWFDLVHTAMAIATKKSGNETYKVGYSFLKHLFWYIENPSWVVGYTRSQVIKHFLVFVPSSPPPPPKKKNQSSIIIAIYFFSLDWSNLVI